MSRNAFADLADFHDPDLYLTIRGKVYRIPQPNASAGLKIRQSFMAEVISDATELDFIAEILGAHWESDVQTVAVLDPATGAPVLDDEGNPVVEEQDHGTWTGGVWSEMDADGVGWEELMHAGRTALIDVGMGRTVAEAHWMQGLAPVVEQGGAEGNPLPAKPEPNRAARRAKKTAKQKSKPTT